MGRQNPSVVYVAIISSPVTMFIHHYPTTQLQPHLRKNTVPSVTSVFEAVAEIHSLFPGGRQGQSLLNFRENLQISDNPPPPHISAYITIITYFLRPRETVCFVDPRLRLGRLWIDVILYSQIEMLSRRVYSVCKNIHYVQDFRN